MNDPFNLSQITRPVDRVVSAKPTKPRNKKNVAVLVIGLVALAVAGTVGYFELRPGVSADTADSNTKVTITGLSQEAKSGDSILANISVKSAVALNDASLVITNDGLDLSEDQTSNLSVVTEEERSTFAISDQTALIWAIGALEAGKTKTLKLTGVVSGSTGSANLQGKIYSVESLRSGCGLLGLGKCDTSGKPSQIAIASAQIKVTSLKEIALKQGWSIVGLPYALPVGTLRDMFMSLQDRKAYVYKPETGEYVDIVADLSKGKEDVLSLIVPGRGILIYSKLGEKISLPETDSSTSTSQDTKINLKVGYNMIGNPYPTERIIFSEQIRIQELADDGTPSGSQMSFKDALAGGVVSMPQVNKNKTFTDSSNEQTTLDAAAEFSPIVYGYKLLPFSGIIIEAKKQVQIVFGSDDLARADLLSDKRVTEIQKCLVQKGLDEYGNKKGTAYPDGAPLDKSGEKYTNPMDSVIDKNLDSSC